MVAAISTALAPFIVPPVANAAPIGPTDTGSFSRVDLLAIVNTRAERAPRADRAVRTLDPQLRSPGALKEVAAVAVAVAQPLPPPVPVVPVAPVATYRPKHAKVVKAAHYNKAGNTGATHYGPAHVTGSASVMVSFAYAQVGKRYVFGATGPSAWDCSGLTAAAARLVGVSLPHDADAQRHYGRAVSRSELQPGDMIFYGGHAAIFVGGNMMIAAANVREGVVLQPIYGTPIAYRRMVG